MMKKFLATLAVAALASPALDATKMEVMSHYADLAQAKYQDSLTSARDLAEGGRTRWWPSRRRRT